MKITATDIDKMTLEDLRNNLKATAGLNSAGKFILRNKQNSTGGYFAMYQNGS